MTGINMTGIKDINKFNENIEKFNENIEKLRLNALSFVDLYNQDDESVIKLRRLITQTNDLGYLIQLITELLKDVDKRLDNVLFKFKNLNEKYPPEIYPDNRKE